MLRVENALGRPVKRGPDGAFVTTKGGAGDPRLWPGGDGRDRPPPGRLPGGKGGGRALPADGLPAPGWGKLSLWGQRRQKAGTEQAPGAAAPEGLLFVWFGSGLCLVQMTQAGDVAHRNGEDHSLGGRLDAGLGHDGLHDVLLVLGAGQDKDQLPLRGDRDAENFWPVPYRSPWRGWWSRQWRPRRGRPP